MPYMHPKRLIRDKAVKALLQTVLLDPPTEKYRIHPPLIASVSRVAGKPARKATVYTDIICKTQANSLPCSRYKPPREIEGRL